MTKNKTTFAELLLNWHSHIDRNLPWKETRDPYKIWLSEIIMQQTRVAQGTPYYLKFIDAFPTITDLANASEDHVMKLWQGLGYYSRARNLHFTAKTVRDQYDGIFPEKYEDILALKGIGKYTAAAISSFAYGGVYPVVDGNVIRLISRYFGITDAVDTNSTLKTINQHAQKLILGSNPADFNQAIMDFGSLICSPKKPNCTDCPFNSDCIAFEKNIIEVIPFKSKKIKKRNRYFHYLQIIDADQSILLNYRTKNDIWQSLYDFPCIENDNDALLNENEIQNYVNGFMDKTEISVKFPSKIHKHILSHQTIYGLFYILTIPIKFPKQIAFKAVNTKNFEQHAMPVLLTNHLSEQNEWTLF